MYLNNDGTQFMTIAEYSPGSVPGPQALVRSTPTRDLNAMNETENRGLAVTTIGISLLAILVGAFYLYYHRNY